MVRGFDVSTFLYVTSSKSSDQLPPLTVMFPTPSPPLTWDDETSVLCSFRVGACFVVIGEQGVIISEYDTAESFWYRVVDVDGSLSREVWTLRVQGRGQGSVTEWTRVTSGVLGRRGTEYLLFHLHVFETWE